MEEAVQMDEFGLFSDTLNCEHTMRTNKSNDLVYVRMTTLVVSLYMNAQSWPLSLLVCATWLRQACTHIQELNMYVCIYLVYFESFILISASFLII